MASEIKYTFYSYNQHFKGLLLGACIGKKKLYDGYKDKIEVYSLNYNCFKRIAVFRLKNWKQKVSINTLNNEVQSIAA